MLIAQWNINGFSPRREQIQMLKYQYNPSIMCFQETNFTCKYTERINYFKTFHKNRANSAIASGGVAIYVKVNILSEMININTPLEALAIQIRAPYPITICNIYLPNSLSIDNNDILEQLVRKLPEPFIITGDFNSHNQLWGCQLTNNRGPLMEKWIDDNNLIILNDGRPTHFATAIGKSSAIDLSICSAGLAYHLNWNTDDNL